MLGLPRKSESSLNNTFLYYENGKTQIYDKRNLFPPMNEDKVYAAGSEPGIFDTIAGRIGIAICYDLRFPDVFDDLKVGGAEMIFVPAAFPRVRINDWRRLLAERAEQTGLPVVGINTVGDDGTNEFGGSTMMIKPNGEVVAQLDETTETYLDIEIEREAVASGNLQIRTEHEQGPA
jgi:predicted amidohydrolase